MMRITKCPNEALALTNCIIMNPGDQAKCNSKYVILDEHFVFTIRFDSSVPAGYLGTGSVHRNWAKFSLNQDVTIRPFDAALEDGPNCYLNSLKLQVDFIRKNFDSKETFDTAEMADVFKNSFMTQIFTQGQLMVMDFHGTNLILQVLSVELVEVGEEFAGGSNADKRRSTTNRGILVQQSSVYFEKSAESNIKLSGSARGGFQANRILQPNFKFEDMGIGGLDKEFTAIFRRAFASRIFPPGLVEKMGIQHVKGILLFGPPGTGKTLIARQIGKMLNAKEPKIVNGPEILNKYVGQSEENVRNLFKEAEADYKQFGDASPLHIIIFDELDAVCKQRGSTNSGTGVGDSVVNQLLSKMDGVEQLNNILIIGMTNRKDMIDEALLRPGRLEVHMEIGLPDVSGRLQIIKIHTHKMSSNNILDGDVDFQELAASTKNYSGAEIAGLVKSASSFAFNRHVKVGTLASVSDDLSNLKVCMQDFKEALKDIEPAFGVTDSEFEGCAMNGIIHFNDTIQRIISDGHLYIQQVRNSTRTPMVSILLHGPVGSGKTSLAAQLAKESDFPFAKLITPENMVGMNEMQKMNAITRVFTDSYKSSNSLIVVDCIERLLEYVPIGPRFSNYVLQTLLILFRKVPPKGRRLLVLATTSDRQCLSQLSMMEVFDSQIRVPNITDLPSVMRVIRDLKSFSEPDIQRIERTIVQTGLLNVENATPEHEAFSIGIKKLLMLIELAKQDPDSPADKFVAALEDYILSA